MASRAQQVYAGNRKYGHAMSIVSVLTGDEAGTKENQKWKADEAKMSGDADERIKKELFQVKQARWNIMLTIFRYQRGRLALGRIRDLYPIAWKRCAEVYRAIRDAKIEKGSTSRRFQDDMTP